MIDVMQMPNGEKIFTTHHHKTGNEKIIVVGQGAPSVAWVDIKQNDRTLLGWYDIVVPDYLWSWRSDGIFSPQWCIDTIQMTLSNMKKWYKEVIYVGYSFGGIWANYIDADSVYLLAPVIDPLKYGKWLFQEEDVQWFYWAMGSIYYNVYRWFEKNKRQKFFIENRDKVNCSSKKVTILHGKKDKKIHYSRSFNYAEKHNLGYALYPHIGHNAQSLWKKLFSDYLSKV